MKNGFMMKKEEELQQQELSLHGTVYITYGDIMLMTDILRKCRVVFQGIYEWINLLYLIGVSVFVWYSMRRSFISL